MIGHQLLSVIFTINGVSECSQYTAGVLVVSFDVCVFHVPIYNFHFFCCRVVAAGIISVFPVPFF